MGGVRVEIDEIISCPVDKAFERATDLTHYEDWMPHNGIFKKSSQLSAGPMGEGTEFLDEGRMGTFHGDVAEFRKPSRVVFDERLRWFGAPAVEAHSSTSSAPRQRARSSTMWPNQSFTGSSAS